MANHKVRMTELTTTIAVEDARGQPVAKFYVEHDGAGETYMEAEYEDVRDLHATDKLLTARYRMRKAPPR